jgi:hypothetical protein
VKPSCSCEQASRQKRANSQVNNNGSLATTLLQLPPLPLQLFPPPMLLLLLLLLKRHASQLLLLLPQHCPCHQCCCCCRTCTPLPLPKHHAVQQPLVPLSLPVTLLQLPLLPRP